MLLPLRAQAVRGEQRLRRVREFVDTALHRLPFPLQDTKGDHAARALMHLRSRRTRLTAIHPAWILADADDLFNVGPDP
jgi:hypothetical protein